MSLIFFIGLVIGFLARLMTLQIERKQYPAQPNVLASQLVLAFIASGLGAILVPALINHSYSSITFLSLSAEQFRKVRSDRRKAIQTIDEVELVPRGASYIEEIALTYEVRNYGCILTSLLTVSTYYLLEVELGIPKTIDLLISSAVGLTFAYILKRATRRNSIGDVADVIPAVINFDGPLLKVNNVVISNIGLQSRREEYLQYGIAAEIIPRDGNYINAGILATPGQRQAIAHTVFSRLGIYRTNLEPDFIPLLRRDGETQSIMIPYMPFEKDMDKFIEAIKSTPILESAKNKNWSISKFNIPQKKGR